jgi:hypothetical protein
MGGWHLLQAWEQLYPQFFTTFFEIKLFNSKYYILCLRLEKGKGRR